jgi:hypothetical protein
MPPFIHGRQEELDALRKEAQGLFPRLRKLTDSSQALLLLQHHVPERVDLLTQAERDLAGIAATVGHLRGLLEDTAELAEDGEGEDPDDEDPDGEGAGS